MKKTFAYATIAALLGVAIMLAPFFTVPSLDPTSQEGKGDAYGASAPTLLPQSLAPANTQAEATRSELSAGITPNYPVDITTVIFMLLFSLAVAFSAYVYVRRSRFLKDKNMPL